MDLFSLTEAQQEIREAILKICARFGDDYWLSATATASFPHEFHRAIADGGWLGIAMPEAYGGSGLGITEAAVMMQAIAESGAAFSGASALHMNIFGLNPVVVFGTEEQKRRFLPPLIKGEEKACFAVTEPDAGLDTTKPQDARRARRQRLRRPRPEDLDLHRPGRRPRAAAGAHHAAGGGEEAHRGPVAVLHRARPQLTSRRASSTRWAARRSTPTSCSSTACRCRVEDRIGEEGKGFEYILHGMNPERILIAAEAVGTGRARAGARRALRQGARRVRPADRPEPGDPASAGASAGPSSRRPI